MKQALPDKILDDRLAFVGTSGAGKTFAAKGGVERLMDIGARVCVVDPLGVWWGMRSSADGKSAAYSVVVFGGLHADVPITEDSGQALARLIAEGRFSSIIDLSEIGTGAARRRFMIGFMEEIYRLNKEPLHLVLDEADLWAPQRPMPDQTMLLNRTEEIVRRGRVRGFIPWLITQRPAVVHKDVLSQADAMITLKLTSTQDRDAFGAWIEGNADKAEEKRIRAALPTLQRGEGFVWAPTHGILSQVQFPPIKTFDSSRTPKRGERLTAPLKAAQVDLASIRDALADVEAKVREDDPAHLKKVIEGLRKELRQRGTAAEARPVDAETLNAEYRRGHTEGSKHAADAFADWIEPRRMAAKQLLDLLDAGRKPEPTSIRPGDTPWVEMPDPRKYMEPHTSQLQEQPPVRAAKPTSDTDLPGNGIGLLKKICELYPVKLTWGHVTALLGRKARGGTFNHQRKVMLERGLVTESGDIVTPTAAGFALTGVPKSNTELPLAKLRELWQGVLPDPAGRMFAALTRRGRGWHPLSVIAQDLGMAGTGGHWNNGIATLRRNGIAEMQGKESIRLAGWLL